MHSSSMKKTKSIHNLDTLEKEIYRLQLEAMKMEQKFDRNFEHLQENYFSMFTNSFFHRRKKREEEGNSFFGSFFRNENFRAAVARVTDRLADKAAESIESLLEKIFHKK
jgi:hypothetical protein